MKIKIALDTHCDEALTEKCEALLKERGYEPVYVDRECDLLLTSRNAGSAKALEAHIGDMAVFTAPELLREIDIEDLIDGYLKTDDWHAKVFSEPVIIANPANLEMKLGTTINPRAIILNNGLEGKGGTVFLDRGTHVGADCLLNLGPANFTAGKFSLISANFSAHAMRHTTGHISNYALKKGPFAFMGDVYEDAADIKIGNDVWIGEGVTCLPGVEIADGSVIGAGSVVTKSTEPYGIYAGNPAKFIRLRFTDEIIELLQTSQWWDFSFEKLKKHQGIFRKDIQDMSAAQLQEILEC